MGFPTHFLQRNWGLFRDEVVRVVQVFFTTRIKLEEYDNCDDPKEEWT
jgi:hypothetical protein